jgi:hypothetical protein
VPKKSISKPIKKKISKLEINNSSKSISKKIDWREKYDDFSDFSEGLAYVRKNGKYGFINEEGKEVIPCIYDIAYKFVEGLAKVEKNGKDGFINKEGIEVVPCLYDWVNYFSEGLVAAKKLDKFGFVDKNGKEAIPFIYDDAASFSENKAWVKKNNTQYFINKLGDCVKDCSEEINKANEINKNYRLEEGMAKVKKNGKFGFIDSQGNWVIQPIFEEVYGFQNGHAHVKQNGMWFFIDKNGNCIENCP